MALLHANEPVDIVLADPSPIARRFGRGVIEQVAASAPIDRTELVKDRTDQRGIVD